MDFFELNARPFCRAASTPRTLLCVCLHVCAPVCACVRACVRVCVCVWGHARVNRIFFIDGVLKIRPPPPPRKAISNCVCVCVCVCACVCCEGWGRVRVVYSTIVKKGGGEEGRGMMRTRERRLWGRWYVLARALINFVCVHTRKSRSPWNCCVCLIKHNNPSEHAKFYSKFPFCLKICRGITTLCACVFCVARVHVCVCVCVCVCERERESERVSFVQCHFQIKCNCSERRSGEHMNKVTRDHESRFVHFCCSC